MNPIHVLQTSFSRDNFNDVDNLYTVIMFDLDADLDNLRVTATDTDPGATSSWAGSNFVHWLAVNVPAGGDTESGTTLLSYQVGWEYHLILGVIAFSDVSMCIPNTCSSNNPDQIEVLFDICTLLCSPPFRSPTTRGTTPSRRRRSPPRRTPPTATPFWHSGKHCGIRYME